MKFAMKELEHTTLFQFIERDDFTRASTQAILTNV